jgi:EmrB/QacA subfamily drug resistance transporter
MSGPEERYKHLALLTFSVGNLIEALDISVLTVCLPGLAAAFKTNTASIGWVNVIYLITSQSLMLSFARIGDALGRKMVYMLGLAVYTLGLVLCSFSTSVLQLIIFRALQGAGAACTITLGTAMVAAIYPADQRGRAIGVLASASAAGLILGPIMGGAVFDVLGFRAIFLSRVPIALAAMLMTGFLVKEQKDRTGAFRLDIGGTISLFCCLAAVSLFLNLTRTWNSLSPINLVLLVSILAMITVFFHIERKVDQPVVDLSLFRNPSLSGAAFTGALHATVLAGSAFLLPFYLADGLGYSASSVGVFFAVLPIPFILLSPLSGRVSDMIGPEPLSALGMAIACGSLFFLGRLGGQPTHLEIALCVCAVGISYGFFIPPNNKTIMNAVPSCRLGTASGIIAATRQVGSSSGIALVSGLFASRFASYADCRGEGCIAPVMKKIATVSAFRDVLTIAAVLGAVGIFTSFIGKRRNKTGDRQPREIADFRPPC